MLEIIGVSQLNYSVQYIHIRDKKFCVRGLLDPLFLLSDMGGGGRGQGGLSSIIKLRMKVYVCMYVCTFMYCTCTMYIHYIQLLLQVHFSSVKQLNSFDRHTYLIYNFISEAASYKVGGGGVGRGDQVIPNSQQGFVGSCQGRGGLLQEFEILISLLNHIKSVGPTYMYMYV